MRTLLAAGAIALACTALLGIQQTVAVALRQSPGATTTLITLGIAALGIWAITVLREG